MGIIVFSLAALFSLPKQFIIVYLGVALEQSANGESDVHPWDHSSNSTRGEAINPRHGSQV